MLPSSSTLQRRLVQHYSLLQTSYAVVQPYVSALLTNLTNLTRALNAPSSSSFSPPPPPLRAAAAARPTAHHHHPFASAHADPLPASWSSSTGAIQAIVLVFLTVVVAWKLVSFVARTLLAWLLFVVKMVVGVALVALVAGVWFGGAPAWDALEAVARAWWEGAEVREPRGAERGFPWAERGPVGYRGR
ncbi:MAG: hypothetical protein M1826_006938 [Phylliscum demangeonii]|nr:MAG: hypothetical protein M1826_006938 [Phylliscum demangeonii]